MTEFLQECFVTAGEAAASIRSRAEEVADVLAAEGSPVTLVRTIFVPSEETLFLLWRADDERVLRSAVERVGPANTRVALVVATPTAPQPSDDD